MKRATTATPTNPSDRDSGEAINRTSAQRGQRRAISMPQEHRQASQFDHVFLHVPRTGGSSVWHCLADAAPKAGMLVCDLYHESVQQFGAPSFPNEVLHATRAAFRKRAFILHHHTPHPLSEQHGLRPLAFTTILREPVERFVSDVFHLRRVLRETGPETALAKYVCAPWGDALIGKMMQSTALSTVDLLDAAAADGFFSNYYVWYFSAFFYSKMAEGSGLWPRQPIELQTPEELAEEMLQRFDAIVDFSDLQAAYDAIAATFGLQKIAGRMDRHLNRGSEVRLLADLYRPRYERLFEQDYRLLEVLGSVGRHHDRR